MSGLAALLAGRIPVGIWRWQAAFEVEDVRHTVEHAGWRFAHADTWTAPTRAEVLDVVAGALDLPDHIGHNFDALADALADVEAGEASGTVLLWDGWGPFAREDHRGFEVTLSVLGTRVNAERGSPFAVLLRGEGPDPVGVPELA